MAVLTANRQQDTLVEQSLREYPVKAAEHVYKGGWVAVDPTGYLKPFVLGDVLLGMAFEEGDNTASGAGDGDVKVRVMTTGDIMATISGVAITDAGKAVFATNDGTLALIGMPDAMVGRVMHYESSDTAVVRLKRAGEVPNPGEGGSILVASGFVNDQAPTGITASTGLDWDGFDAQSALGLGVTHLSGANGGTQFEFDNPSEVATAALIVDASLLASAGIRFETRLHLSDKGTVAILDSDWGVSLGPTITGIEAAADRAIFHMDGGSNNILLGSDDDSTEVALVDSSIDNVETAGAFKDFLLIVRPTGVCEFWIDNVRAKASTVFAVRTTAVLAAFDNMEKEADTTLGKMVIRNMRVSGAIA